MLRAVLILLFSMLTGLVAHAASEADRTACLQASGDKAVALCGRIIADAKSSIEHRSVALFRRASVLGDRRQYEAAIADLDQLVTLQPNHALAFNRRGHSKAELNRHDQAIADFDKAIAIDPGLARAYNGRGNAHRAKGEFDRALVDYAEAMQREPGFLWPLRNRAYAHERLGLFAEAEAGYQQVIQAEGRPDNNDDRRAKRDAESDLRRLSALKEARARNEVRASKRVALIIANTKYKGTFDRLATPANDARALAAALKRLGFKDEDVVERHDLDRKAMIAALRAFEAKARTADWATVFFAGHGVRARSNLDYMIPIDANITSEKDLADEAVALERVVERIADAKKLQLVVFDACRGNELTRRLYSSTETKRAAATTNPPFEAPGLIIAFSARRGQSAFDGKTHSPFVEALLANLDKPGVDLETVLSGTAEQVRKATREQQSPEIYGLGYGKGVALGPGAIAGQR